MKYMAIIDVDEKPVSCEFFGCNGNVRPYLLGATTDIKALEQEPVLDKIRDEICDIDDETVLNPDSFYERKVYVRFSKVIDIIDKYKTESEEKE